MDTDAEGTPPLERVALLRLLQLASPALPIGAFAYSQGLEAAVTAGLVTDEQTAASWILGLLAGPFAQLDLAVFARLHRAFRAGDLADAERWNAFLLASRATAELQAEDRHLGAALARVLLTLGIDDPDAGARGAPHRGSGLDSQRRAAIPGRAYARMFALAAARWGIDATRAAEAFAFTWGEAQVSAAVRLIPLGQSAGVRVVGQLARAVPLAVDAAALVLDDEVGAAAPLQALLSAAHEMQYSRLFRS